MSTRALAWTAAVLGVLLVLLAAVAANRLGYLAAEEKPGWVFRNHLLDCEMGTYAVLRPAQMDLPMRRYWMVRRFAEPPAQAVAAAAHEVARYAHVRAGVEVTEPPDEAWRLDAGGPVAYFAYRQLGALTHREFLEGIELVTEDDGAGGTRRVVRARFATPSRGALWYFYDPAAEDPRNGFGWERVERHATGVQAEVFYLTPGGFREPPPPPKKRPKQADPGK